MSYLILSLTLGSISFLFGYASAILTGILQALVFTLNKTQYVDTIEQAFKHLLPKENLARLLEASSEFYDSYKEFHDDY